APTAELDGMCRELVARAVADEAMMRQLAIPPRYWNWLATSFKRGDPSLYGRFDLRYDGKGPAKLLEYNADTPTSAFETGVFQWLWLGSPIKPPTAPKKSPQSKSLRKRVCE